MSWNIEELCWAMIYKTNSSLDTHDRSPHNKLIVKFKLF